MRTLLRAEEAAMFMLCVFTLTQYHVYWWVYLILILGPDIGMVGYIINEKAGAILYNSFHHKGIAIAIYAGGLLTENEVLQIVGIILFGHASMDRIFGYGLKYFKGFKHTHLGLLDKRELK